MSNFVNLLDIVYPVGSMYFSATDTSPASAIGGTWEQIKDAVLAASGDSYAGAVDKYNGEKHILYYQMPFHSHGSNIAGINASDRNYKMNAIAQTAYNWTSNVTGTASQANLFNQLNYELESSNKKFNSSNYQLPEKYYSLIEDTPATSLIRPAGGGQNYIPYHYSINVWKRIA